MTYQASERIINTKPIPKFEIDGVIITSCQFMHNEFWYVVNNSWCAESTLKGNYHDTLSTIR